MCRKMRGSVLCSKSGARDPMATPGGRAAQSQNCMIFHAVVEEEEEHGERCWLCQGLNLWLKHHLGDGCHQRSTSTPAVCSGSWQH